MNQQQVLKEQQVQKEDKAIHNTSGLLNREAQHPMLKAQNVIGNHGVLRSVEGRVQAKLKVGSPDDKYEQEADQIADQIIQMSDPCIQKKCTICEQLEEEEDFVQPKSVGSKSIEQSVINDSQIHISECGGQPLSHSLRSYFEPRFGYDFSDVRMHTCDNAVQMNRSLNARAFTYGNSIFFNQGQYDPSTSSGKHLLAHELAHVVQQGGGKTVINSEMTSSLTQAPITTTSGDRFESVREIEAGALITRNSLLGRSFLHTNGKMMAGLGGIICLSQKIAYWGAAAAMIAACGGAILTSETGIGLILLGAACVAAIIAYIAAIVALKECVESDPNADRREIEELRQEHERMQERLRQVEELLGMEEGNEGGSNS